MTVEQGLNRFYEEHYGEHAPNSGTSIINALNDILDAEEQDKQIDVGEAAYAVLSLYSGSGGDEVDGILMKTISGAYTNERVTSIGDYAFYGCTSLTSVDLPVVTSIGSSAFSGCTSLTSVDLPVVTSIRSSAFGGCTSLTSVDLPAATTISNNAFESCRNLTSVDLPAATDIGSAFYGCINLTSVILRNTSRVVTLSSTSAFTNANNAIIYVPDSLVDSYKEASNWSTYASRIKGLSELPTDETESEP